MKNTPRKYELFYEVGPDRPTLLYQACTVLYHTTGKTQDVLPSPAAFGHI